MEQDSYPAFYGEPSLAVPSPSHMFQNANDFTITGSRFMNVQGNMNIQPIHTGVRDVVLSLLEQERQGGRVVSGVPGNTLSPPAVYSASTNYCHQLVRQGRGFPMYVPSPQQNLPAEYRRTGIAIGDVGRVTPEGGFDFFFNIYRSASDPINANHVPQDFVPLSPYDPFDLTHYDFDCGEYVSTPSVYDINGGFSEPTPGEEFVFKCRGPDGAVLALPHGAHLEKLENLERMRQYAGKHAESWYRYVNEPGGRGRGLVNGSLCLITGCEKSKSWGMASFQNVSVDKEFPLSFRPTADEDNGYRYRWNGARCRHKQADPPLVDGTPLNQTTFIHAFTISLREGLWGKLFGDVEVAQLVDSFASPDKSGGGFVPFGSQGSPFSWSLNFFGFNSNNGGNQSRTLAQGNTIISDAWPLPQIFHPSRMIHERILREVPGANVVITHDDDWRDIFKDNNLPMNSSDLQHMIFDRFNIVEEEGTVFLRDKSKNTLQDALTVNAEEPFAAVEEQAQDNSLPNTSSISPAVVLEAVREEPSIEEQGANRSQPHNDRTKIFGGSRKRLSSLFLGVSTPAPDPQHHSPQVSSMPNMPPGWNKSEKIMLEIDSTSSAVKPQQDPDAAIQGSHDEQNDISHLYWSSYKHRVPDEALNKADSVSPTDPALSAAEEPFGELKPLTRKLGSVSLPEDEKDKKVSGLLPTLHSADSNPLSTRHDLLQQYPDTGLPYASPPHNPGYPPPHASHTHNPRYPPSSYNAGPPTSRLLGLLGPSHRPPEDELAAQLQGLELIGYRQRRPSIPALYSAYSNPLPTRHNSLQQYPDRSNPAERTNPRHPRGPPPSGHNPPSSRASWHAPDGPSWVPQQQPYPPPANTPQWSAPPPGSQPLRSMSMNPPTTSPSHRYGQSPPQTYPINQPPPPGSQPLHSMSMSQPPMASPSHRHAQLPPQAYPMNKSPGHPPSSYNAGPPTSRLPGPGHRPPEDELAAQLRLTAERAALQKDVQPIFECGVCFDKYPEDYVSRVADCSHEFCRDCMKGYVISKLKDKLYPIFCPMCVTDNARAEPGMVTDDLVQMLGLDDNEYQTLQELQIASLSILLHCRKCKQSVFVDRLEYEATPILVCPLPRCNYAWCKACQQTIPMEGPKHSCDGSSELEHLMKSRGWKHCPGCNTPFQKSSGCNHMTCMSPGCNTHFCYVCGKSIVRSAHRREIQTAVSAHYRRCNLFEDVLDH